MPEDKVVAGEGEVQQWEPELAPVAEASTFAELGMCREPVEACDAMGWKQPTEIQAEAIPYALKGRDIIGLGQTGSGKTGAFALPIIQSLLEQCQPFFACVISPTRELAIQIAGQFEALGSAIGLVCSVLVEELTECSKCYHCKTSTYCGWNSWPSFRSFERYKRF